MNNVSVECVNSAAATRPAEKPVKRTCGVSAGQVVKTVFKVLGKVTLFVGWLAVKAFCLFWKCIWGIICVCEALFSHDDPYNY